MTIRITIFTLFWFVESCLTTTDIIIIIIIIIYCYKL